MSTSKMEFEVSTDTISFPGRTALARDVKAYSQKVDEGISTAPPKAVLKRNKSSTDEYLLYFNDKPAGTIESGKIMDLSLDEIYVSVIKYTINKFVIVFFDEEDILNKKKQEEEKRALTMSSLDKKIIKICKDRYYFSSDHIKKLCDYWNTLPDYTEITDDKNIMRPDIDEIVLYDDNLDDMVILNSFLSVINRKHIQYSGPASSGKNIAFITLAAILKQPYVEVSINDETDKYELLGSETINNEKIDGEIVKEIVFKKEPLINAIEYGYLCVLDEFNLASPGLLPLLNSLTDTRKSISIPKYKRIEAHPKFNLCLTCNEGYAGTAMQNPAFLSRFNKFLFEYPSSITNLLSSVQSSKINKLYKEVYNRVVKNKEFGQDCLFIRSYVSFDDMINAGADPAIALKVCLTNKLTRRNEAEAIITLWTKML